MGQEEALTISVGPKIGIYGPSNGSSGILIGGVFYRSWESWRLGGGLELRSLTARKEPLPLSPGGDISVSWLAVPIRFDYAPYLKSPFSPYVGLAAGYGAAFADEADVSVAIPGYNNFGDAVLVGLQAGCCARLSPATILDFEVAFNLSSVDLEPSITGSIYSNRISNEFIDLRGLSFAVDLLFDL